MSYIGASASKDDGGWLIAEAEAEAAWIFGVTINTQLLEQNQF